MLPDDSNFGFGGDGGVGMNPPTFGSADPTCEDEKMADGIIPFDTLLKPEIEHFCSRPGQGQEVAESAASHSSIHDAPVSSYLHWEHLCFYGKNNASAIDFVVNSKTNQTCHTGLQKDDCVKQLTNIAKKCTKGGKNNVIAGGVYDQNCFG